MKLFLGLITVPKGYSPLAPSGLLTRLTPLNRRLLVCSRYSSWQREPSEEAVTAARRNSVLSLYRKNRERGALPLGRPRHKLSREFIVPEKAYTPQKKPYPLKILSFCIPPTHPKNSFSLRGIIWSGQLFAWTVLGHSSRGNFSMRLITFLWCRAKKTPT